MSSFRILVVVASYLCLASARLPDGRPNGNVRPTPAMPEFVDPRAGPIIDVNGNELPPTNTIYYFDQLIDHTNPSLGTFKQRYWHTWEFYEPGGCIVLTCPGESNAETYTAYLTNRTIQGQFAQQDNCATIVLEHRFFGYSNPYPDLSVKSLQVHTIQQAIDDFAYFANNAHLPMPNGDNVKPATTPWVFVGGSYSGALASWLMVKSDAYWAAYGSSAVVQSIAAFWQFFEPIRKYMPQNCSADVQQVITHVDKTFTSGTEAQISALKSNWGLGGMDHIDDVAGALRNNLWNWQSLQPVSNGGLFYNFCDALEVKDGISAPIGGWGLDHALQAWGSYWNATYYSTLCGDADANTCLGTYDTTQDYYTDITVNNRYRSWMWIVCNEVGWFQDGVPEGWPTLVTRLISPQYDIRQCSYYFPEAYASGLFSPRVRSTNIAYEGWDVREPRIFFANGLKDPWREATVSAMSVSYPNTTEHPVGESDGFHCSDLKMGAGANDASVIAVQQQALASMKRWIAQFPRASSAIE